MTTYQISSAQMGWFVALAVWELIWKGFALWQAAQKREKGWFVVLLVVNSVGILPIAYLLRNKAERSAEAHIDPSSFTEGKNNEHARS